MRLFGKRDEAEELFAQAKRLKVAGLGGFDLNLAIHELKELTSLKPNDPHYHSVLGDAYLEAPEVAVPYGVNVGFRLTDSARLALSESEEAVRLYERDPSLCPEDDCWWAYYGVLDQIIYAHLCLGAKEKAKDRMRSMLNISSFYVLKEPKRVELPGGHVEVIIDGLAKQVGELGKLVPDKGYAPGPFAFADDYVSYTEFLKSGDLASLVKEIAEEIKRLKPVLHQRDEARRHIEKAVIYRNLEKYEDAAGELQEARQFAPSVTWWYETLCELGS